MSEKDGGPAFPAFHLFSDVNNNIAMPVDFPKGITMRQYYKAAAITGITASPSFNRDASEVIAGWVSRIADVMLAEDAGHEGEKR